MRIRLRSPQDLLAGLLFIGFALLGLYLSSDYDLGTATRMGPGYVPRLLCFLLVLLGAIIALRGFTVDGPALGSIPWRPLVMILAPIALFAVTLERLGLVISIGLLIGIASLASSESRRLETVALAIGLAAFSVALFVYGLKLPLRILP